MDCQPDTERKQEVRDAREVMPCVRMQINMNRLISVIRASQEQAKAIAFIINNNSPHHYNLGTGWWDRDRLATKMP